MCSGSGCDDEDSTQMGGLGVAEIRRARIRIHHGGHREHGERNDLEQMRVEIFPRLQY
jgi:hypothetical protein